MTAPVPAPAAPATRVLKHRLTPPTCEDCGRPHGCGPYARLCDDCRWKHKVRKPREALTPEREAYMREKYRPMVPGLTKRVAKALQVPSWRIREWSILLGLCQPKRKEPRWTPADEAFLEAHIGRRHPHWIATKLGRTVTAIVVRAKRLEIDRRAAREWWTANDVAMGFGIDCHVVLGWMRQGLLRGTRYAPQRRDGREMHWQIFPADVRRFVRTHPTAFLLWKVDQPWFLDLVFSGDLGERRNASSAPATTKGDDE